MTLVLAFDIERSGSTDEYDTIAIGASVVDENLEELDSLLLLNYRPNETQFEDRCWEQFWSKHQEILDKLEYTGTLTKEERDRYDTNLSKLSRGMGTSRKKF